MTEKRFTLVAQNVYELQKGSRPNLAKANDGPSHVIQFWILLISLSILGFSLSAMGQQKAYPTSTREIVAVPASSIIRWSGKLVEEAGRTVKLRFAIFEYQSGGLPIWTEIQLVKIEADGQYAVLLGSSSKEGVPPALFQGSEARWIEIAPITESPLASNEPSSTQPRTRILLTAVPYAFEAINTAKLAGRDAEDYVTRDDLHSAIVRDLDESIHAHPVKPINPLGLSFNTQTIGNPGSVPVWISQATLGNSVIYESGTNVGFGTMNPAAMLDVNGSTTLRGAVSLEAGVASSKAGADSPSLQFGASTYSSEIGAAVPQTFAWKVVSEGNNSTTPTASLELLFGSGSANLSPTGLSIAPNGVINFAPDQTLPGANPNPGPPTASGSITSVIAGPGLTGGGSNGAVTLTLSLPVAPANGGTGATNPAEALVNLGAQPALGFRPLNPTNNLSDLSDKQSALSNLNGSVTIYPEWFGAVGDGVHDDTAAFRAAFAALQLGRGTVHLGAKTYVLTGTVDIAGTGSGMQVNNRALVGEGPSTVINCRPASEINACFRILNGSDSSFRDLYMLTNSNVLYGLEITTLPESTERVYVSHVSIVGGQNGVAIGPDSHNDVSAIVMDAVNVSQASGAGFIIGDGISGNVLNWTCTGCGSGENAYGVLANGSGFTWQGGSVGHNSIADFYVRQIGNDPITISGIRSEESNRFLYTTSQGATPISIRDCIVSGFRAADGHVIWFDAGANMPLLIENSIFVNNTSAANVNIPNNGGNPWNMTLLSVGTSNPSFSSFAPVGMANVHLFSINDFQTNAMSGGAMMPGSGQIYLPAAANN